ncbi:two-partner secretion domain-containing protein, partial [Acinetobacter sp.]
MNKNLYRIIFSKARNMFIAVAENSKSQTKAAGESACKGAEEIEAQDGTALHQHWVVKSLVASISLWMPLAPVYAQIQADAGANPANRPVIGVGQNAQGQNVPVVNIQTPVNGVSHNIYKQMDVLSNGAVLNNSRTGAASAIAGSVGANPFLAKGEARLILNEINSTAATRFEGNLEVAGQRADVIIANPAGINIKGGGFINANKAIFTTGKPQLNADGSLKQFAVDQGKVTVSANAGSSLGLGGNSNNADYVDIYARALELNAQLHANQAVNVITGANTVSENLESIESKASASAAPALAVDIKSLGGMYANNIYLMGNEKGLGVSNAGTLQAVNNLVVTSAGKIVHSGTAAASDKKGGLVSIATTGTGADADIAVSGSINGYGLMNIDSGNDLNLNAKEITVNYDSETKNSAALIVSAKGNVSLAAGTRINNLSTAGDLYLDAKNITLAENSEIRSNRGAAFIHADESLAAVKGVRLVALNDLKISADTDIRLLENTLHSTLGSINIQSAADTANLLQVDGGTVYAGQDLNVYGAGDVSLKNLSFNLVNDMTRVKNINAYSGKNLVWNNGAKLLPKIAGKVQLEAKQSLDLSGTAINAVDGIVTLSDTLTLSSALRSDKGIDLTAQQAMNLNYGSKLNASGDIALSALQGSIQAGSLKADTQGKLTILANKDVTLSSTQNITGQSYRGVPAKTTDKTQLNADKGIIVGSAGDGNVSVASADVISNNGDIQLLGKRGVNVHSNIDTEVLREDSFDAPVVNKFNAKSILIENKKGNIEIKNAEIISTVGSASVNSAEGMLTVLNSTLKSKGNTEIYAKDLLTLKNVTANSDQHLAVNSKRTIYLNADYTPAATVWDAGAKTALTAKGILSLTAEGNQVMQNATLTGGAVLLETSNLFVKPGLVFNAAGSDLLKNDTKLNSLNGDLSIQATGTNGLTIDPKIMSLSAVGDIELIAKNGVLKLAGYGGPQGNGSEQVIKLNTTGGGISLEGAKVEIQGAQLNAQKDIKIISSKDAIVIDGVKNNFINQKSLILIDIVNNEKLAITGELNKLLNDSVYVNKKNYLLDQIRYLVSEIDTIDSGLAYGDSECARDYYSGCELIDKYSSDIDKIREEYDAYIENENKLKSMLDKTNKQQSFTSQPLNGYEHINSSFGSNVGNINIVSNKGLSISGSELMAKAGQVNLESRGVLTDQYTLTANSGTAAQAKKISASMIIDGHTNFYDKGNENDANYSMRTLVNPTVISGAKGVSIRTVGTTSGDNLVMQATGIVSQGDIKIESNKNILFDSAIEQSYDRNTTTEKKKSWGGLKKKYITTVSENNAADAASVDIYGKNISIESKDQNK